jgi:hypothetical protein
VRSPRVKPGAEQIQAAFEGGAVSAAVELGGNEREDHVRQLLVEFIRLGFGKAGVAEGVYHRPAGRGGVRSRGRTREERYRPGMSEQRGAASMRNPRQGLPPIPCPRGDSELGVELVGYLVEQVLLAADVTVPTAHWLEATVAWP